MKNIICITIGLFLLCKTASSQPGTLDKSFSNNGKAFYDEFNGECVAIASQADGKIITGGYHSANNSEKTGSLIERFNVDGSVDESFGDKGRLIVTDAEGRHPNGVSDIFVLPNGKIVCCIYANDKYADIGLIRLNSNGTFDNSFSENGIAIISLGQDATIGGMLLQTDGKIIIGGKQEDGAAFLLRYLLDGAILDESFGENGIVLNEATGAAISELNAIALQPDGKIILSGRYFSGSLVLIRYLPDGKIDLSFDEDKDGVAGIRLEDGDVPYSYIYDLAIQPDGKIVAAGTAGSSFSHMVVIRFNSDGSVDTAFGDKPGYSILQMESGSGKAYDVTVTSDKKIILSGLYYLSGHTDMGFGAAKYNEDGSLDVSFGDNGLAVAGFDEIDGVGGAGIVGEDGKITIGGWGYHLDDHQFDHSFITMVRFNNEIILPIIYSKFSATQTKEYITLNWQTTTELNNKYFAVERSSNAVNYTAVAQVNSIASGAAVQDYAYTDKLPLAGTNYYRLKQVDKDGKFSYSKTVSIGYIKPGSIQLFPNPAKDKLTVKGLNAAITSTIAVLDIQGKQLLQFTAKAAAYSFSIGSLAPGTYMVWVKDVNGTAVEKFVKQ